MKLDKEVKNQLNYLFDILNKNNVKQMNVSFYGSGDDGNMEISEIIDCSDNQKEINLEEPTIYGNIDLYELVLNVTDHILDKKGIDYANGQGNQGCVVYTVAGKQVEMEYLVTQDAEYTFNV